MRSLLFFDYIKFLSKKIEKRRKRVSVEVDFLKVKFIICSRRILWNLGVFFYLIVNIRKCVKGIDVKIGKFYLGRDIRVLEFFFKKVFVIIIVIKY